MSQENVEVVRRCYELWAKGDYSFIKDVAASDCLIDLSRNTSNPAIYRGYEGFGRWVETVQETWDQFTVVPQTFIDAGEHVLVSIRVSGKAKGSDEELDVQLFNVWTLRAGKVWHLRGGYRDRAEAMEAAGLRE